MSYPIERIAKIVQAQRVGSAPATIDRLLTDSRSLNFADGALFFALKTKRNDGTRYIPDLYGRGVRNFVVTEQGLTMLEMGDYAEANFLVVTDTLRALQRLVREHRLQYNIPVVGITGSNGKTVVKEWLNQLVGNDYRTVRSPRSYNSQIGVPLSVWQLNEDTTLGIFEAGISKPEEMSRLQTIIKPTIGIFSNIGGAHQENFFSMQEKCMEKMALFKDCDVLIYDGDDEMIASCVSRMLLSARELAWSRKDKEQPLFIRKIEKRENSTLVAYRYLGMDSEYLLPFVDDASIENSLNCLAACLYLRISPDKITARMLQLEPVAMRLEVKEGKDGCVLINDSYNLDMTSLDMALNFMERRSQGKTLKRTLVLSDILETGQNIPTLYRKVARLLETYGVQRIVGVGQDILKAADQFGIEKVFYPDTEALIDALGREELEFKDELVLIKGARKFKLDVLSDLLEKKVHETILEVNLSALTQNLDYYRSMLRPDTKMVCMVKASAYGAGSLEVAKTLQEHRVDYLAVAVADEGSELRKAGITANILIMNPEMTAFKTLFDYGLEPEVYSFRLLEGLIKAAEKEGVTGFPIHIKIDTGMHRLGFLPEEMPLLIDVLKGQHAVVPRSIFSHLVGSDSPQFDGFTRHQIETFEGAANQLQAAYTHRILRHIDNTAGIERFPGAQFDMVRLGLGLYGVNPIDGKAIHNVCTLKTTILQIHRVTKEDTVGYSRKGLLERDSRIAAIPIGYADGLNRHLGNGHGYCLVNGQKAPYVGNICMDVCMIDVTDIDCEEGDRVEIFGNHLPVSALSDVLNTIPYEVLAGVSTRVKRIYYQD